MKVVLIIGLPASGKSTYIKKNYSQEEYVILDDYGVKNPEGDKIKLKQGIAENRDIVIADVHFCKTVTRESAIKKIMELSKDKAEIEQIFFENNIEKCYKNMETRHLNGDKRIVEPTIRRYSAIYVIPEGVVPVKIVCP